MSDEGKRIAVWPCDHGGVVVEPGTVNASCRVCGERPEHYVPASELERLEAELQREQTEHVRTKAKLDRRRADIRDWAERAEAAEARVRALEGALERIAEKCEGDARNQEPLEVARYARAALNPPAEDEQHWPDEPLMHPPPKRVQKLRVHLKPADEERHKEDRT